MLTHPDIAARYELYKAEAQFEIEIERQLRLQEARRRERMARELWMRQATESQGPSLPVPWTIWLLLAANSVGLAAIVWLVASMLRTLGV